jgi:hypothetical protein
MLITVSVSDSFGKTERGIRDFYIPRLKCTLTQNQFYSEIFFTRETKPKDRFTGELRNYVTYAKAPKKFISGLALDSVIFEKRYVLSGSVGDAFHSDGVFKITSETGRPFGNWKFIHTNKAGTPNEAVFTCSYGDLNSRPPIRRAHSIAEVSR